jgi:hypothetical protein
MMRREKGKEAIHSLPTIDVAAVRCEYDCCMLPDALLSPRPVLILFF